MKIESKEDVKWIFNHHPNNSNSKKWIQPSPTTLLPNLVSLFLTSSILHPLTSLMILKMSSFNHEFFNFYILYVNKQALKGRHRLEKLPVWMLLILKVHLKNLLVLFTGLKERNTTQKITSQFMRFPFSWNRVHFHGNQPFFFGN